jgi:hypothetical protein
MTTDELEAIPSKDLDKAMEEGANLSAQQVADLENKLRQNPKDYLSRVRLLGYYTNPQNKKTNAPEFPKIVLGFIEHHPRSEMAAGAALALTVFQQKGAYEEGATMWLQQVSANQRDPKVLGNAGAYFTGNLLDPKYRDQGEAMLQQARTLDPKNPKWAEKLAELYDDDTLRKRSDPVGRQEAAKKALDCLGEAFRLTPEDRKPALRPHGQHVFHSMAQAAILAGQPEKAKNYAANLLKSVNKAEESWNYGNAIHKANIILGHLALKENKIAEARLYLLEAGKTPGSPQLDSFGPDMSLAYEMLVRGERDAVIQYLDLCAKFWRLDRGRLATWKQAIQAGQIPNFERWGQF